MIAFTTAFILSQVLMVLAMGTDFLSFQFRKREHTIILFGISAVLISAHYFLLAKITAGIIVFFSVLRFITCYFTTEKNGCMVF